MGREDGGHRDLLQPQDEQANAGEPLVEVCDEHGGGARQPGEELRGGEGGGGGDRRQAGERGQPSLHV